MKPIKWLLICIMLLSTTDTKIMAMKENTTFLCSSYTLCNHPLYENIMVSILHYATVHYCPEIHDSFNRFKKHDVRHASYAEVHKILYSDNPRSMIGSSNATHIVIGPEPPDFQLVYNRTKMFTIYDRLFMSGGPVSIVHRKSINFLGVIEGAICYAHSFLALCMLLACSVAIIIWYAVSTLLKQADLHKISKRYFGKTFC